MYNSQKHYFFNKTSPLQNGGELKVRRRKLNMTENITKCYILILPNAAHFVNEIVAAF